MKVIKTILLITVLLTFGYSCKETKESKTIEESTWKLGWRMIENSWDKKFELAEIQFDSLLHSDKPISDGFIISGLKIKLEVSKEEEASRIISNQSNELQAKICGLEFAKDLKPCENLPKEKVGNKALQLKIIDLYVKDQAIRGNIMGDIISKDQIDTTGIKTAYDWSNPEEVSLDVSLRNQLKEIFEEYGPPTKKLIGKDAMRGVLLIIQHADGDTAWQKSQLPYLEAGAKTGEFTKSNYAYLYDRIKVNSKSPQRYGSQFAKVDFEKGIAELRETEDLEILNQRRREMDMMPIEMYKRLILRQ